MSGIRECPQEPVPDLVFSSAETFEALWTCERFLTAHGFSYGSWQRGAPCGVMFGSNYDIAKWRNLSGSERADLHASFSGDGRHGPITLKILPACPAEGLAALEGSGRILADATKENAP